MSTVIKDGRIVVVDASREEKRVDKIIKLQDAVTRELLLLQPPKGMRMASYNRAKTASKKLADLLEEVGNDVADAQLGL